MNTPSYFKVVQFISPEDKNSHNYVWSEYLDCFLVPISLKEIAATLKDEFQKELEKEAALFAHDQVFDRNTFRERLTAVGVTMGEWAFKYLSEIADKDEENYGPEGRNNDEAVVASHSCTSGNSIENLFQECADSLTNGEWLMSFQGFMRAIKGMRRRPAFTMQDFEKGLMLAGLVKPSNEQEQKEFDLLNTEQKVQVSDTRDDASSNDAWLKQIAKEDKEAMKPLDDFVKEHGEEIKKLIASNSIADNKKEKFNSGNEAIELPEEIIKHINDQIEAYPLDQWFRENHRKKLFMFAEYGYKLGKANQ